jgi:hypothetical protein
MVRRPTILPKKVKLNWPSTVTLALHSGSRISDTTGEQAGTPEHIEADPYHWRLISETNEHEETVIDRLVDFAEYAIETTDYINESIAKEIEAKAEKAAAWGKQRATWLKEQGEALEGKGHGKKKMLERTMSLDGKLNGRRGKKVRGKKAGPRRRRKTWMSTRRKVHGGWGPWPEDAVPNNTSGASGSGTKASRKGKGTHKSTCEHCGKWGSHKPEECRENPANSTSTKKGGKGKGRS